MLRVIGCLTLEHDLHMVLLAAAVCVFGTLASWAVSDRALRSSRAGIWLCLLAVCATSTVWATHFIAMLAYQSSMPMTYAPWPTLASFVLGLAVMGGGFCVALRGHGASRSAGGGALLGAGVAALHYTGMAGLTFPGRMSYASDLVITSIVLACALGAAGMTVARHWRHRQAPLAGGALLVLMIVCLHFTGMGALRLELGMAAGGEGMSRGMLAVAVTLATLGVLVIGLTAAIVDRRISGKLAAESERFRTLADAALEAVVIHRDGRVVDFNSAARQMLGLGAADGNSIDAWFRGDDPSVARRLALAQDNPVELDLPRGDGSLFPAELWHRDMRLADGTLGELLAIRDLTLRRASEARIAHLALHDPLTDLPNRRLFVELAGKAISQAERSGARFALLAIDLDGFKLVNDMHGHSAGDELLRMVAARASALLRDADTMARIGGDEFVVLQTQATQPGQAWTLAERLLEALTTPFRLGPVEVGISASIGIALYPEDGRTVDELVHNADTAMYRAKADGKATCRFFEPQMDAALEKRRRIESRLRLAVAADSLEVAYQPLVDSTRHEVVSFEALVRWRDAELGVVSPVDFIPVAEETGLIVAVGEQVLMRACREAAGWSRPLRVAVNLSAVQFRRRGLVESVRRALQESGLAGERLELEVTESLLIDNRDEALSILSELKALGARVAMDDFGTGYSSLSYLQSFPFDKIKIDRVFVSNLETGSQSASIVRAVASMGRSLNMRVVAEGVETRAQAEALRELDCDELQGYLIARPMPAGEVEDFLAAFAPTGAERAPPPRREPALAEAD